MDDSEKIAASKEREITMSDSKDYRRGYPKPQGLYLPEFDHDACGVGFVAHLKGKASHKLVHSAIEILENMEHRGAVGYDPNFLAVVSKGNVNAPNSPRFSLNRRRV